MQSAWRERDELVVVHERWKLQLASFFSVQRCVVIVIVIYRRREGGIANNKINSNNNNEKC